MLASLSAKRLKLCPLFADGHESRAHAPTTPRCSSRACQAGYSLSAMPSAGRASRPDRWGLEHDDITWHAGLRIIGSQAGVAQPPTSAAHYASVINEYGTVAA